MVKEVEQTIKTKATFSDDERYRYKLSRVWDERKPKATIVALNPSEADSLKLDKTLMNVSNFLIDKGYGSMTSVNLFAYRAKDPTLLSDREQEQEKLNNHYISEALEAADLIIVAWIRGRDKYPAQKREVERLLMKYKDKVKCFADAVGKKPRHPRDFGEDWKLEDYEFEFG